MDKVNQIFSKVLDIPVGEVNDTLSYNDFEPWDSIRHMKIIARLEEEFKIELEMQDIIDMSTVGKAKEILKKYVKG